MLFLYCYSLRKRSSQVEVLWEDHRNDLFLNGFGTNRLLSLLDFLKTHQQPRHHYVSWR